MKIDGSLARNIDFEVANFQVLRKTRRKTSILKLQSLKIGGSLARNARPRVSSRVSGFPVASPCLWGKLQNLSFSKVSKQVVMSFCVAGAALFDNLFDNVSKVVLYDRRNTSAPFSQDEVQFSWHSQHFGDLCLSSFCVAGAALHTPHSTL